MGTTPDPDVHGTLQHSTSGGTTLAKVASRLCRTALTSLHTSHKPNMAEATEPHSQSRSRWLSTVHTRRKKPPTLRVFSFSLISALCNLDSPSTSNYLHLHLHFSVARMPHITLNAASQCPPPSSLTPSHPPPYHQRDTQTCTLPQPLARHQLPRPTTTAYRIATRHISASMPCSQPLH